MIIKKFCKYKQYSICGMNEMSALGISQRAGELPSVIVVEPKTGRLVAGVEPTMQKIK